jgi:hypothetical protein
MRDNIPSPSEKDLYGSERNCLLPHRKNNYFDPIE